MQQSLQAYAVISVILLNHADFVTRSVLGFAPGRERSYQVSRSWPRHDMFPDSSKYNFKDTTKSLSVLFSKSNNDESDEDDDDDEAIDLGIEDFDEKRMEIVRILQKTYYRSMNDDLTSTSSSVITNLDNSEILDVEGNSQFTRSPPKLDEATGRITNLPLWRVGWVETPGRRNCLNVHEGKYTHMFETILSSYDVPGDDITMSNQPLYFGHLYLPGGTAATRTGEDRYQLKTWREELEDENRFYDGGDMSNPITNEKTPDRSAVIGCLMQIMDHRRMEDGRLMILVQAVERFVVEEILETKPFSVANVQILLDQEGLSWNADGSSEGEGAAKEVDENSCKHLRGKAVTASFYYHDYEFDKPKLPIADENAGESYLSKEVVPWVGISKLLPFAHYSSDDVSLDAANDKTAHVFDSSHLDDNEHVDTPMKRRELPLEQQLWNGGILWNPPPVSKVVIRSVEETTNCESLETLLWLALDDFCRATKFVIPEEVRCLVPPEMMDYLDIPPPSRYLSPTYPKIRRQRRLSYLAPALIENLEVGKDMRQVWLNTPSTRARLLGVLERFDYLNNYLMGQFE